MRARLDRLGAGRRCNGRRRRVLGVFHKSCRVRVAKQPVGNVAMAIPARALQGRSDGRIQSRRDDIDTPTANCDRCLGVVRGRHPQAILTRHRSRPGHPPRVPKAPEHRGCRRRVAREQCECGSASLVQMGQKHMTGQHASIQKRSKGFRSSSSGTGVQD